MFSHTRLEHIRMEFAFIRDYKNRIRELEQEVEELKAMLPSADVITLKRTIKKGCHVIITRFTPSNFSKNHVTAHVY